MLIGKEYPQFRVLSVKKIRKIHEATLNVLEQVGVRIYAEEAIELFKAAGCKIRDNNQVKIPSPLVEKAIQDAPSKFTLYNRDGMAAFVVGENNICFGTSPTAPFTHDIYTGKRRSFKLEDSANAAKLANILPNIDFVMPFGTPQDVPRHVFDIYAFEVTMNHTKKPIVFLSDNVKSTLNILKMAGVVAGGMDNLRKKPFIAQFVQPLSPLFHTKEAMEKLITAVKHGIPVFSVAGPVSGATHPISLAGSLVLANAEILTQLTVSQLIKKGTPFGVGLAAQIMDMATANACVGTPECCLSGAAFNEIARYYNLPTWGTAGTSDAKVLDEQAAIEITMSILTQSLSGLNMIHDLGYLENGLVGSLQMLVMGEEIVGSVKRMLEGIIVNKDTLSLETIEEVGIGGEFLTSDQTLKYYKTEHWHPTLMDRKMYASWVKSGAKTMRDRINEKTQELVKRESVDLLPRDTRSILEKIRAQGEENGKHNL